MDKTNYFWRHKAGNSERARLPSNSENREHLKNFRNVDCVLAKYNGESRLRDRDVFYSLYRHKQNLSTNRDAKNIRLL